MTEPSKSQEEEATETAEPEAQRKSPPVVVLDSSTDTDVKGYRSRPPPTTNDIQLVVTYVNMEGIIFGVEVDEGRHFFIINVQGTETDVNSYNVMSSTNYGYIKNCVFYQNCLQTFFHLR